MDINKFYDKAYDWVILRGPSLAVGIIVFIVGQWFINVIKKRTYKTIHKHEVNPTLQPFFRSLIYATLQVLLILLVMQIVGIQLTVFATLVGAFGVAAGLALSGTLQNFTSGILILLMKPFIVGDNIIAQGQEGTVTDIRIFYTVLTTYDNKVVIIPNSKLSNELIVNLSREGKRRMDIEIKLPFTADISHAKELLEKEVQSSQELLKEPEARTGVSLIEPDGLRIMVNVWTNAHGFQDTKLILQQRLIDALKNGGIKLVGM